MLLDVLEYPKESNCLLKNFSAGKVQLIIDSKKVERKAVS